jgi:phenolic acid decarboxylase
MKAAVDSQRRHPRSTGCYDHRHRDLFILFAARYRLPASILGRYFVTVGALMSCGIDNIDVLHKAVPMSIASCALQSLSKRL